MNQVSREFVNLAYVQLINYDTKDIKLLRHSQCCVTTITQLKNETREEKKSLKLNLNFTPRKHKKCQSQESSLYISRCVVAFFHRTLVMNPFSSCFCIELNQHYRDSA